MWKYGKDSTFDVFRTLFLDGDMIIVFDYTIIVCGDRNLSLWV